MVILLLLFLYVCICACLCVCMYVCKQMSMDARGQPLLWFPRSQPLLLRQDRSLTCSLTSEPQGSAYLCCSRAGIISMYQHVRLPALPTLYTHGFWSLNLCLGKANILVTEVLPQTLFGYFRSFTVLCLFRITVSIPIRQSGEILIEIK